jgi:hypothetical protein
MEEKIEKRHSQELSFHPGLSNMPQMVLENKSINRLETPTVSFKSERRILK